MSSNNSNSLFGNNNIPMFGSNIYNNNASSGLFGNKPEDKPVNNNIQTIIEQIYNQRKALF